MRKILILSVFTMMVFSGNVFSSEGHDHGEHKGSMMEQKGSHSGEGISEAINVGNKICPVSGEANGSMGEAYHVEHEGKVYNLCCKMCAKDFKKDPEKFIKNVEEELAGQLNASENVDEGHHDHGEHDH